MEYPVTKTAPSGEGGIGSASSGAITIAMITAASAIVLAWSATLCLHGAFQSHREPQRFTIEVSGSAEDPATGVKIQDLFVDGRRPVSGVELKGDWRGYLEAKGHYDSWDRAQGAFSHAGSAESASLSFSGRSAAVLFGYPRGCGHLSISTEAGKIWDDDCAHSPAIDNSLVAVDLPLPGTASRWPFVAWLAVFLVIAAAVRPWMDDRRLGLWLVLHLLVLHFLVWSTQPIEMTNDSIWQYDMLARNLSGQTGYFPPGYPLLVGLGYLISATAPGSIVTLMQHLMMVATTWWCFQLIRRCVIAPLAFLTALAIGTASALLFLAQAIMSENVGLFGMAGALYFALRYRDRGIIRDAIVSGLLLGWAGLARIVPLAAGIPAIFLIMLGTRPVLLGLKRFGAIFAVVALSTAAPVTWFGIRSGSFALANSFGEHLYNRVVTTQGLLDETAPATSHFLQLVAPVDPRSVWAYGVRDVLREKGGLDYLQTVALLGQVAWEAVRQSPWKCFRFSFWVAWRQYLENPAGFDQGVTSPVRLDGPGKKPWWGFLAANRWAASLVKVPVELDATPILGVHAGSLLWREALRQVFAAVCPFLPWLALAGLASTPLLRQKLVFLSIALMLFLYLLVGGFADGVNPRYVLVLFPFVFCLACGPFAAVTELDLRSLCRTLSRLVSLDPDHAS